MIFKEVLRPPIWLLAFIYFLLLSLVIAIWAAFDTSAAVAALMAATVTLIYAAISMRSSILIDERGLRIDRAHIDLKYIGSVDVLNTSQMRLLRTRDADPAAYLAIKFWISTGVKITVLDPRDPTPYWLVTSKRGDEMAALLKR